MSNMIYIINSIGVKGIFCIICVCAVIFVDINLYVLNNGIPPLSERCSSKYPEFSIVLDNWVTLPDGSLQISDGTVYPPGASWESGGVFRGCPCTIRQCSIDYCNEHIGKDYRQIRVLFELQTTTKTPSRKRPWIYQGMQEPEILVVYVPPPTTPSNETMIYEGNSYATPTLSQTNKTHFGSYERKKILIKNRSQPCTKGKCKSKTNEDDYQNFVAEGERYNKNYAGSNNEKPHYNSDEKGGIKDNDYDVEYFKSNEEEELAEYTDYTKANVYNSGEKGGVKDNEYDVEYFKSNEEEESAEYTDDTKAHVKGGKKGIPNPSRIDEKFSATVLLARLLLEIILVNSRVYKVEYLSFVPQCEYSVIEHNGRIPYERDISEVNGNGTFQVCFFSQERAFLDAFLCTRNVWFEEKANEINVTLKKTWRIIFVVLAILVHLVTLVVFVFVPHLQTIYNKYLVCYLIAQIIRKSSMVVRHFSRINTSNVSKGIEELTFGASYFGSLSYKCWQLAAAHSIWMMFSCQRVSFNTKHFVIYSIFAWTVPLMCTLIVVFWVESEQDTEISQIDSIAAFVPGLAVEVCCTVLCGLTVRRLRVWQREDKDLRGADSRRYNAREVRWSLLLVKVILLDVGLEYIIFTVLTIARLRYYWSGQEFPLSPIWYKIPDDFNNLRGVQIFFFFVLKKDVWVYIRKQFEVTFTQLSSKNSSRQSTSKSV